MSALPAPGPESTLAERLRWLADVAYNGSVNAMAVASGVKQRSLAMAVSGETKEPRKGLLIAVRDRHQPLGLTLNWLREGEGTPPSPPTAADAWQAEVRAQAEVQRLDHLLFSLELPDTVRRDLDDRLRDLFDFIAAALSGEHSRTGATEAQRQIARTVTRLLDLGIKARGVEGLRQHLITATMAGSGALSPTLTRVPREEVTSPPTSPPAPPAPKAARRRPAAKATRRG